MYLRDAFIVKGLRTPIGKHAGSLSNIRADDLAASIIKALLEQYPQVDKSKINDVILGCANQAGEDNRNVARMALLLSGLPYSVPGETVNRLCASGMSAVIHASNAIKLSEGELFIAGGIENMTRAPFVLAKSPSAFSTSTEIYDTSIGWRFPNPKLKELYGTDSMGQTAENLAELYNISRYEQDEFAYSSQCKASDAARNGRFLKEIHPLEISQPKGSSFTFKDDEFIKPETTLEVLSSLKPAFRKDGKGTVTAGNSSGINDGACALIVASENALKEFNLKPAARILSYAIAGVEPRIMGIGPVKATEMALQKCGLKLDDISVIEINEAFASQCIACFRELKLDPFDKRINPNGGAIALGHPLGMSGARLVNTAAIELEEKQGRFALCTMCVGVGQGMAVILERI